MKTDEVKRLIKMYQDRVLEAEYRIKFKEEYTEFELTCMAQKIVDYKEFIFLLEHSK